MINRCGACWTALYCRSSLLTLAFRFTRGPLPVSSILSTLRCALQLRQPCFNILQFDSFDGVSKDKLGRPESDCGGYVGIGHELQGNGSSSASGLLHSRNSLLDDFIARL